MASFTCGARTPARDGGRRRNLPAPGVAALTLAVLVLAGPLACSSGSGTDPDSDPLARLAGTWNGTEMVITSRNAEPEVDILGGGFGQASFTLEIEESGRYTATLIVLEQPDEETGTIDVTESAITLDPDGDDPPVTGTWSLDGGTLTIDGETEFDFDFDGTDDPADLHLELERA